MADVYVTKYNTNRPFVYLVYPKSVELPTGEIISPPKPFSLPSLPKLGLSKLAGFPNLRY